MVGGSVFVQRSSRCLGDSSGEVISLRQLRATRPRRRARCPLSRALTADSPRISAGGAFTEDEPTSDVSCRPSGTAASAPTDAVACAGFRLTRRERRARFLPLGPEPDYAHPVKGIRNTDPRRLPSYHIRTSSRPHAEPSREQVLKSASSAAAHRFALDPAPLAVRANSTFRFELVRAEPACLAAPRACTNAMRPIDVCHPTTLATSTRTSLASGT